MNKTEKKFVYNNIIGNLSMMLFDNTECEIIANSILDDVVNDIIETADENSWNSNDISIAIKRVIKQRILFNN